MNEKTNIFVDGMYAGNTGQNLLDIAPADIITGEHTLIFSKKGYYDKKVNTKIVDGQIYLYPELNPDMPFAVKLVGGILLGLTAYGIGKAIGSKK